MPELPEVETVRRVLETKVVGKTIAKIDIYHAPIVVDKNKFTATIEGCTIQGIDRIGKYLLFDLGEVYMVSHLRMEGKYFVFDGTQRHDLKHTHVVFNMKDGTSMQYHDTRKFGRMQLVNKMHFMEEKPFVLLGKEPWACDVLTLYEKLKRKHIPIKQALLDQHLILGLGNIYVNEVLFETRIHPLTKSNQLSKKDIKAIVKASCCILETAIKCGGTTIRSYTSNIGVDGRFQQQLKVQDRQDLACVVCNTPIVKIQVNGRGTYFCPTCQKRK